MKKIHLFVLFCMSFFLLYPQEGWDPKNFEPTSPQAAQFLRYTDFPAASYTGIPDIAFPLYNISTKDFDYPLQLKYHSFGSQVQEDASNVGLGWSLNKSSIVQIIQDVDDFKNGGQILPDWHGYSMISEFPARYNYPFHSDNDDWMGTMPIHPPQKLHTAKIAIDYYMPLDGSFMDRYQSFFESDNYYDSAPDIFKANFNGHSLTFKKEFGTHKNNFVVLDKIGYKIERLVTNDGQSYWSITAPDGIKYNFNELEEIITTSGAQTPGSSTKLIYNTEVSEKIYHLTSIKSFNGQEVFFEYEINPDVKAGDQISQKMIHAELGSTVYQFHMEDHNGFNMYHGFLTAISEGTTTNTRHSYSQSDERILTRVTSKKEIIDFSYSSRLDKPGSKKLDFIKIRDRISNTVIDKIDFYTDYFVAPISGNRISKPSFDHAEARFTHRLKLDSLKQKVGGTTVFKYNSVSLPHKLSLARDFWGFYNGRHNDVSLAPNPARFSGITKMGDNGNNKSAVLKYASASILQEVYHPTGGKTFYEYELNEFDNYIVPNAHDTNNSSTAGLGLRIKSIKKISENNDLKLATQFSYAGGKAIQPKIFVSNYQYPHLHYAGDDSFRKMYSMQELNNSGYYSSNLLGSISGVGYDEVSEISKSSTNLDSNGKMKYQFHNNPDITTTSLASSGFLNIGLPSFNPSGVPNNGLLKRKQVLDSNNALLVEEIFYYDIFESDLYYGVKTGGYGNHIVIYDDLQTNNNVYYLIARNILGYYPIFGKRSRLKHKKIIEKFEANLIESRTYYSYDSYDQIKTVKQSSSTYEDLTRTFNYLRSGTLFQKNKFDALSSKYVRHGSTGNSEYYSYVDVNNMTLPSAKRFQSKTYPEELFKFDKYDDKGNIRMFHTGDGVPTVILWGYNKTLPIAKITGVDYDILNSWFSAETGYVLDHLSTVSNQDISTEKENILRDWLQKLRSAVNKRGNGFETVDTYTHNPLVGISSQTDSKGFVIFYEYDTANRLSIIRDADGSILSETIYNYKEALIEY